MTSEHDYDMDTSTGDLPDLRHVTDLGSTNTHVLSRLVMRKPVIIGGVGAFLLIVAIVLLWLHLSRFESTDDAYTTADIHPISTRIEGSVIEVLVDDNESVIAGQLLMRLDPRDFAAAQLRASAKLEQASAAISERQAQATQAMLKFWQPKRRNREPEPNSLKHLRSLIKRSSM